MPRLSGTGVPHVSPSLRDVGRLPHTTRFSLCGNPCCGRAALQGRVKRFFKLGL